MHPRGGILTRYWLSPKVPNFFSACPWRKKSIHWLAEVWNFKYNWKMHMSAITGIYDFDNQCENVFASGVAWLLALVGSVSASKIFGSRSWKILTPTPTIKNCQITDFLQPPTPHRNNPQLTTPNRIALVYWRFRRHHWSVVTLSVLIWRILIWCWSLFVATAGSYGRINQYGWFDNLGCGRCGLTTVPDPS